MREDLGALQNLLPGDEAHEGAYKKIVVTSSAPSLCLCILGFLAARSLPSDFMLAQVCFAKWVRTVLPMIYRNVFILRKVATLSQREVVEER